MGPIHAEHYHFDCFDAVFGLGWMRGEGWQGWRGRKPSQHCTAIFRITRLMMFCSSPAERDLSLCTHEQPTFSSTWLHSLRHRMVSAELEPTGGGGRCWTLACGPAGLGQNKAGGHFMVTVGASLMSLPTEKAPLNVPPTRAVVAPSREGCWFKPQGAELAIIRLPCPHPHEHQRRT